MAVEMDRQSSGHTDSSDYDGEEADFSLSLHKKEMFKRKYDDDDDDDGAFSQTESEGLPELDSPSSGDDVQDHQDSQDFIRESAKLFESDGAKKSKQRLADFTLSELLQQRLIQLEKEEQPQKSCDSQPGSVTCFQREFDEDKVVRDMLRDQATSRKRSFRTPMSPPLHKPSQNDASGSESSDSDSIMKLIYLHNRRERELDLHEPVCCGLQFSQGVSFMCLTTMH